MRLNLFDNSFWRLAALELSTVDFDFMIAIIILFTRRYYQIRIPVRVVRHFEFCIDTWFAIINLHKYTGVIYDSTDERIEKVFQILILFQMSNPSFQNCILHVPCYPLPGISPQKDHNYLFITSNICNRLEIGIM